MRQPGPRLWAGLFVAFILVVLVALGLIYVARPALAPRRPGPAPAVATSTPGATEPTPAPLPIMPVMPPELAPPSPTVNLPGSAAPSPTANPPEAVAPAATAGPPATAPLASPTGSGPTASPVRPTPTPQMAVNTFFVDSVRGNDGNSGSSALQPWQSLTRVNSMRFKPGDVINLARGSTWTGPGSAAPTLVINGAGAPGNPITVQAYGNGPAPILRNPSTSDSQALVVHAPWVIVQNLMVRDAYEAGIYLEAGADHTVVLSNEATQVGAGVLVRSHYNLIAGNYIHETTIVADDPSGSYGANGVLLHASNNEVAYNRLINCKAASEAYGTDGGAVEFFGTVDNISIHHNYAFNDDGFSEVGGGSARNVTIAYNVIANSGTVVGLHFTGQFASTVDNFQFVNNTVVDSSKGGAFSLFWIDGQASKADILTVRNNIFYVNNYVYVMQDSTNFVHDHNLYYFTGTRPRLNNYPLGPGEKIADPQFVDPAGGNFQLRASSPAIGAGVVAASFAADFYGQPLGAQTASTLGASGFATP